MMVESDERRASHLNNNTFKHLEYTDTSILRSFLALKEVILETALQISGVGGTEV